MQSYRCMKKNVVGLGSAIELSPNINFILLLFCISDPPSASLNSKSLYKALCTLPPACHLDFISSPHWLSCCSSLKVLALSVPLHRSLHLKVFSWFTPLHQLGCCSNTCYQRAFSDHCYQQNFSLLTLTFLNGIYLQLTLYIYTFIFQYSQPSVSMSSTSTGMED